MESPKDKQSSSPVWSITLGLIVLLAAGLRLWGLLGGPPLRHPDEIFMVVFPLNFFSGDLNPHRFYYPTFHFYLLGAVYGLCFLAQKLFGAGWSASEFVAYHYFWNPEGLLVWARLVSVAFAVGTVWWTACLARRLYGASAGLAAGLLLAVGVVHVRQTVLAGVDAALAFWCVGAVWAAVRLLDREELRDYVLAGVLLGLAAGTKYPAAVLGLAVLAAHLLGKRSVLDRRLWLAALTTFGTFALVSPYLLLDFKTFLGHFLFQVDHTQKGRSGAGGFAYHLIFTLSHNLGWPALLVMAAGIGLTVRHGLRAAWIVSISFLVYYLSISWGELAFTRYAMPLLPLQAVLVAGGIQILPRLSWQVALAVVLAVGPLYGSVRVDQVLTTTDTRELARAWIETNVPAGSICCNFGGWAGDVPVQTFEDHWWRLKGFADSFGEDTVMQLLDFMEKTKPAAPFYSYAVQNGKEVGNGSMAAVETVQCPFVFLHRHPLSYSRIDSTFAVLLQERGQRLAFWVPEGLHESVPQYDPIDAYYVPLGDFGALKQPGPEIEVWRLEEYPTPEQKIQTARDVFATAYLVWAAHMHKKSDDEGARHYLSQALAAEPDDAGVYISIGTEYRKLHEAQKAIEAWEKALAREPDNKYALYNIALVYQLDMEHPGKAISYWQRAIQAGIDIPDAYIHLANAHLLLRQGEEAKQWFRKAIERYPDLPQGPQIRQMLGIR
ncbi:MAG: hypothetical protein EXS58_15055 [Candidatus Latescibacteria bacterium]|nr:hypothetical protein [Candidatus Latescibacterota bacterium]